MPKEALLAKEKTKARARAGAKASQCCGCDVELSKLTKVHNELRHAYAVLVDQYSAALGRLSATLSGETPELRTPLRGRVSQLIQFAANFMRQRYSFSLWQIAAASAAVSAGVTLLAC